MTRYRTSAFLLGLLPPGVAVAAGEPDPIFRKSTVFKLLPTNDKFAMYANDDLLVVGLTAGTH
jgi:CreA protein